MMIRVFLTTGEIKIIEAARWSSDGGRVVVEGIDGVEHVYADTQVVEVHEMRDIDERQ